MHPREEGELAVKLTELARSTARVLNSVGTLLAATTKVSVIGLAVGGLGVLALISYAHYKGNRNRA